MTAAMPFLHFKGKALVENHHLSAPFHELLPVRSKGLSKKASLHDNLIIAGDNLAALKALLPTYHGKVKCIYIDPPYNTGNEGWAYNDKVNSPMMQDWLGNVVDRDDLTRHDKWCCMMWPRLQLLRELLAEDGVIFVSIDDNEAHRLRMIMDEIFGEDNFYAMCNWTARNKPMNAGSARFKIQKSEEYVLVYGKMPMSDHAPFTLEEKEKLEYPHTADNGRKYREEEVQQRKNIGVKKSEKMVFSVIGVAPRDGYRWTIGQDTAERLAKENKVFARNGKLIRIFFSDEELDERYHPLWANFNESCGTSETGKKELDEVVKNHNMETVKPVDVVKKIVFHFTNKDSIVLDSFAGSGTTAHAVLAQNKEDGGTRRFILVECEDYVDSLTAERVRRVAKGVPSTKDKALKTGLGGAFSYFKLGRPLRQRRILDGSRMPSYEELAAYVFFTATGEEFEPEKIRKDKWFIGRSRLYDVFLIYEADRDALKELALSLEVARKLPRGKRKKLVFAPIKHLSRETLHKHRIAFSQLPFQIYEPLRA